jgi:hypothetical protein
MARFEAVSGAAFGPGLLTPSEVLDDLPATAVGVLGMSIGEIDDATTAYVLAIRPAFNLVREGISQLAGLMVLATVGARNEAAHDILERICHEQAEARDIIRRQAVPNRALHHHRHLAQAGKGLDRSLKAAAMGINRADPASGETIMKPLRAAYQHLQWATGALPGFEVVALSQGCCSAHASWAREAK